MKRSDCGLLRSNRPIALSETNETHAAREGYALAGGANGPSLYRVGRGPALECRSVYNSST
jgi:hypothetical protein